MAEIYKKHRKDYNGVHESYRVHKLTKVIKRSRKRAFEVMVSLYED